jgi:hypothetical protein
MQSRVVWDDATALLMLHYMAEKHAYRKRVARYVGGSMLASLAPGDVVMLTDSSVYLSEVPCIVLEATRSLSDVALDLVLLEHPMQMTRRII